MLEKMAFEVIQETTPMLISAIKVLLNLEQTPQKIARRVSIKDPFLAGLVEMAAEHMQQAEEEER